MSVLHWLVLGQLFGAAFGQLLGQFWGSPDPFPDLRTTYHGVLPTSVLLCGVPENNVSGQLLSSR